MSQTTTTNASNTLTVSVKLNNDSIFLKSEGGKGMTLPLPRATEVALAGEESNLLSWLVGQEGKEGVAFTVELTMNDAHMLRSIGDRCRPEGPSTIPSISQAAMKQTECPPALAGKKVDAGPSKVDAPVVARMAQSTYGTRSRTVSAEGTATTIGLRQANRDARRSKADDLSEAQAQGLQSVVNSERAYFTICYYIPDAVVREFTHPSQYLWQHGFRLDGSVWIIPQEEMQSHHVLSLIATAEEYADRGMTLDVIEVSEAQKGSLKRVCLQRLTVLLRDLHTRLIERIAGADKALQDAEVALSESQTATEQDSFRAHSKRDNAVRSILKAVSEDMADAIRCAELYDSTEQMSDLFEGLRASLRAQIAAFNLRTSQRGVRQATVTV